MFDNFHQHKILLQIFQFKMMHQLRKDMYVSVEWMTNVFPKQRGFDRALLNLFSKGYIDVKKESGEQKVNLEQSVVFAYSNDLLRKEQYRILWTIIKDVLTLLITIPMAAIAIIALNRDTSKFVEKEELYKLQKQIIEVQGKSSQLDSQLRIYQTEIKNIKTFSKLIDTLK